MSDILLSSLIPSGSGFGGINYIKNFNAEDGNTLGWFATNPADVNVLINDVNVVRGTKSFNLSKASGSQINKYIYYPFTIDSADINKQLTISLDYFVTANYAANDVVLQVRDVTNGVTINVANPGLPKFTSPGAYSHKTSFMSTNSTSYELRLVVNTTNSSSYNIYFDNVRVGPDSFVSGTPVTDWQSVSLQPVNFGIGAPISGFFYRRVGNSLEVEGKFTVLGVAAGVGSILFPSHWTIDASSVTNNTQVGEWCRSSSSSSQIKTGKIITVTSVTNQVFFSFAETVDASSPFNQLNTSVMTIAGESVSLHFSVPIAQWAGSTVSIDNSQVEYAFNTGTNTAAGSSNTTDFAYGPQGAEIGSINSTTGSNSFTSRRVRFLTPIQPTDVLQAEILSNNRWIPFVNDAPWIVANSVLNGSRLVPVAGSATDVDIWFGNGGRQPGNTYGSTAGDRPWSGIGTLRWRVSKSRNPLSIGGLTGTKWQRKSLTSNVTSTTTDVSALKFLNLQIGRTYRLSGQLYFYNSTATASSTTFYWRNNTAGTGTPLSQGVMQFEATSVGRGWTLPISLIFIATTNLVTLHVDISNQVLVGSAAGIDTYTILEELSLHTQTSEWT